MVSIWAKGKMVTFKDGWWNGRLQKWFLSGQMMEDISYKEQVPVGNWKYWFENGQLKRREIMITGYHLEIGFNIIPMAL